MCYAAKISKKVESCRFVLKSCVYKKERIAYIQDVLLFNIKINNNIALFVCLCHSVII